MVCVCSQRSVDKAFFSLWSLDASLILHPRFSLLLTNMALVGVGAHGSHKLQLIVKKNALSTHDDCGTTKRWASDHFTHWI